MCKSNCALPFVILVQPFKSQNFLFAEECYYDFYFVPNFYETTNPESPREVGGIKDMYFENQIEQNSFEAVSKLLQSSIRLFRYRAIQSSKISDFMKRLKWVVQKLFPKSRSKINFPSDFSKLIQRWI